LVFFSFCFFFSFSNQEEFSFFIYKETKLFLQSLLLDFLATEEQGRETFHFTVYMTAVTTIEVYRCTEFRINSWEKSRASSYIEETTQSFEGFNTA